MEFSEVSELNLVIGYMKLGSSVVSNAIDPQMGPHSYFYHNSRDSEVDRLFNSSPPINAHLEDFSIDDMSVLKVPNEKSDTKIGTTKPNASPLAFGTPKAGANEVRLGFKKEAVQPIAPTGDGELTRALLQSGVGGGEGIGNGAPLLNLSIYFPDRSEMSVDAFEVCTVEEAITTILRAHKKAGRKPGLYYSNPECYEMRLHEGGGEPDTDFPALDRSRKLKHFGDAGDMEFVLCEIPSMCPPAPAEPPTGNKHRRMSQIIGSRKSMSGTGQSVMKIIMPNAAYTILPIGPNTRPNELLQALLKKHRLQAHVFGEQYVFHLSDADQARLGLISGVVDVKQRLQRLGVEELELRRKIYADAPQLATPRQRYEAAAGNSQGGGGEGVTAGGGGGKTSGQRPDLDSFMFNEVTATAYKEWSIVKKNKFGKKQHRIMGVDRSKIYNKKAGDRGVRRLSAVTRAERLISSIYTIDLLHDDQLSFRIVYDEGGELNALDYTAETPYDCAEIVARVRYIMRMGGRQDGHGGFGGGDHLPHSFGGPRLTTLAYAR